MNINSLFKHKMIARQYVFASSFFILLGYALLCFEKWYLSPTSDTYTRLSAVHGTIIVVFGIVPLAFAGLGYASMPLAEGDQMYFPRLDRVGLILFYLSAFLVAASLLTGKTTFILAMFLNFPFAMACSVNFIATILHLRNSVFKWIQMRSLVWTLFVTAFLIFLNFLLLEYAASMQLVDAFFGSNFWLPSQVSVQAVPTWWKHLFWFLGHPEVYILLLAIVGIAANTIRMLLRKFR